MGIRADMTPQVARMDAHQLRQDHPTRLCYLGTVLHTRADGLSGGRSPLQIGAEIFGHAGVESDMEILRLMWSTLQLAGVRDIYLDLGHVGIFRALARQAGLDPDQELDLFEALQRKAMPEIGDMVRGFGVSGETGRMLLELADLNGDDALERARDRLAAAARPVWEALDYLFEVARRLERFLPEVPVHFDLAELRGYHYKTGVVFAAFVPQSGQELARGGRYDAIGEVFGRARAAVGFSTDLKILLRLGQGLAEPARDGGVVAAPWSDDPGLQNAVESLRAEGLRVLSLLPGQRGGAAEMGCTQVLVKKNGGWTLEPVG
jgi:ATP phosphoribosyltransferase regulatory subunit